ncbi:helix-turn-helix domain-containing protein [Microbacterium rhizomatis]|uniref:Sigma-70 family RNA polymerase sigma factor n=1 Tax=Microbacterium rhizomatis TaxID=1631477 RepID=A0A5J5J0Q9_9MICO|nr:helix-turn-helix domain-containing protein [Microbacterium rhizomatis]KAA9105959.1 sigma-70 family RNA polymerase sigma factor [Microbacterium rhizomatis]
MMERTTVCPPDHKHGDTPTCYRVHRCSCSPCCAANTKRCYERKKLIAYGRYDSGMSSTAPVKLHIGILLKHGMTVISIAAAAGVSTDTIRAIWFGSKRKDGPGRGAPPARIHRSTAERIIAVQTDLSTLPPDAKVSSRGMRRRIQALGTLGWAQTRLARLLGVTQSRMARILTNDGEIPVELHIAAASLFERLWNARPPHESRYDRAVYTGALDYARRHCWLPAMAWDDIDNDAEPAIEDPEPIVDEVAIDLALLGERVRMTREERHLAIQRARELGYSLEETAQLLGVTSRTVLRVQHTSEELEADQELESDQRLAA